MKQFLGLVFGVIVTLLSVCHVGAQEIGGSVSFSMPYFRASADTYGGATADLRVGGRRDFVDGTVYSKAGYSTTWFAPSGGIYTSTGKSGSAYGEINVSGYGSGYHSFDKRSKEGWSGSNFSTTVETSSSSQGNASSSTSMQIEGGSFSNVHRPVKGGGGKG